MNYLQEMNYWFGAHYRKAEYTYWIDYLYGYELIDPWYWGA